MPTSEMPRSQLAEQTRRSAMAGFKDFGNRFLACSGCSRLTIGTSDVYYFHRNDGGFSLYGGTACYHVTGIDIPNGCAVRRIPSDEAADLARRLTHEYRPGVAVAAWHNLAIIQPDTMLIGYCVLPVEGLTSDEVILPLDPSPLGWTLTQIVRDYRVGTNAQWQQLVSRAAEIIMRRNSEALSHAPVADCAA